tara:strand:- start:1288 stop:1689 length:402 start_codon:yes stop_codon:yes gene_type:complete
MPKIKFEKTLLIGSGTIPWYMKAKRWAKKQKFPISFLLLGVIEWLKNFWIDVKIYNNMRDIDRQAEALKKHWEEHDEPTTPHVVETGVFGDEGWSIEISNPVVERGTPTISTGMVTPSDAQRLQEDEGDKGAT